MNHPIKSDIIAALATSRGQQTMLSEEVPKISAVAFAERAAAGPGVLSLDIEEIAFATNGALQVPWRYTMLDDLLCPAQGGEACLELRADIESCLQNRFVVLFRRGEAILQWYLIEPGTRKI